MEVANALQPEREKLVPQRPDVLPHGRVEVIVVDRVVIRQRSLDVLVDVDNVLVNVGVVEIVESGEAGAQEAEGAFRVLLGRG